MLPLRNQNLILRIRHKLECPRHILPFDRSTNDGRITKTNNSHSLLLFPGNDYFQISFSSPFSFFPFFYQLQFLSPKKKNHSPPFIFAFIQSNPQSIFFRRKKPLLYLHGSLLLLFFVTAS